MNIKIVVHKAEEGGFWAEVPSIPGCFSQRETMGYLRQILKKQLNYGLNLSVKHCTKA